MFIPLFNEEKEGGVEELGNTIRKELLRIRRRGWKVEIDVLYLRSRSNRTWSRDIAKARAHRLKKPATVPLLPLEFQI